MPWGLGRRRLSARSMPCDDSDAPISSSFLNHFHCQLVKVHLICGVDGGLVGGCGVAVVTMR